VGLSRLSSGDGDGAREALTEVVKGGEAVLAELRAEGAKDGFTRAKSQPILRASHALGCLAYDQERYADALVDLERVYQLDQGPVGVEARLIAGKTFVKSGKPADAIPVLEEAAKSAHGPGRAYMGLALAHFAAGDKTAAADAFNKALVTNAWFGKAVLGQFRKQVDNPLGATPGSREEAAVYAQTYGDVWDDSAKEWLGQMLAGEPDKAAAAPVTEASAG
jgi:tetratricopeptide (TPR) repeat protein